MNITLNWVIIIDRILVLVCMYHYDYFILHSGVAAHSRFATTNYPINGQHHSRSKAYQRHITECYQQHGRQHPRPNENT
jgi:hypothetical protein